MINRKTLLKILCLWVGGLAFLSGCQSKHVDVRYAGWENVMLTAKGLGAIQKEWSISARVQAVQAAKIAAYAQLESQAMRLKTDAGMTVSELVAKDETLGKKITAFVRGAEIIRTENVEAGVAITMELFLGDSFKTTLGLSQRGESAPSSLENRDDHSH